MDNIDKIVISLEGSEELEEADRDYLPKEEVAKVQNILSAMEAAEGIGMPFGTCMRVAGVYQEIKAFLAEKEVR